LFYSIHDGDPLVNWNAVSFYEVENPVDQYLFRYFEIDPARREWVLPTSEIIDVLRRGELGGADPHRLHGPVAAALGLEPTRRRFPN
jgi:hypothetical protein